VFWLPFAFLCIALIFVNFFRHNLFLLRRAGLYWLAILVYLLLLFALSDLSRLFLFLIGKTIPGFRLYSVGASLLLCAILIIYGTLHVRSIHAANYQLTLPGQGVSTMRGIRIALISDLHIGPAVDRPWVKRVVDTINRSEPDMVCIAGDVFDGNVNAIQDIQGIISELRRINAPLGVYACLGNHDVDRMLQSGTGRITNILREAGIVLLQDEVYTVAEGLSLAGRRDARPIGMNAGRKSADELLAGINGTIIMLDHQPTQFPQLEEAGADLVLCGHTHAGQLFPANLLTRSIFKKAGATHYGRWQGEVRTKGTQTKGPMQAVVTSGAGFWGPPVRIGTNSEVVVIDVKFSP
jgi:predicted MPP superfamily phosphohydrolase